MDNIEDAKIFSLGENAATVDFGNRISAALNDRVLALADFLNRQPFAGMIEIVPAYSSLTIFYDLRSVRRNFPNFPTAFAAIENILQNAIGETGEITAAVRQAIEIPVCFDREFALDLELVAAENNLTESEVIEIFLNKIYRVFLLGFLPGFSYMGEVDERIAAPRKSAPRLLISAGSVGIAGRQTGIYSLDSPGGWQIIGRTPLAMFNPKKTPPTILQAGDSVKFVEISAAKFHEFTDS